VPDRIRLPTLAQLVGCPNTRIGHIMPAKNDHWWEVTADGDVAAIQRDVESALVEHALPWLEQRSDLGWLATYYRGYRLDSAAACYVLAGDLVSARECLLGWIAELEALHIRERARITVEDGQHAIARVRTWGRAVGLDV
jgi:hypothetical protein